MDIRIYGPHSVVSIHHRHSLRLPPCLSPSAIVLAAPCQSPCMSAPESPASTIAGVLVSVQSVGLPDACRCNYVRLVHPSAHLHLPLCSCIHTCSNRSLPIDNCKTIALYGIRVWYPRRVIKTTYYVHGGSLRGAMVRLPAPGPVSLKSRTHDSVTLSTAAGGTG